MKVEDLKRAMKVLEETPVHDEPIYVWAHPNQYATYCEWFGSNNVRLIQSMPVQGVNYLRVVK